MNQFAPHNPSAPATAPTPAKSTKMCKQADPQHQQQQFTCKMFTDFSIESLIGTNKHALPAQPVPRPGNDQESQPARLPANTRATLATAKSATKSAPARKHRPKNFQCPACKMAFSNNGQLKNHVRIHTGERPFRCAHPDCNKSFTRNEELTRHKIIHTGVRPHNCAVCGKRFGRKDHLNKHIRTHDRKRQRRATISLDPVRHLKSPAKIIVPSSHNSLTNSTPVAPNSLAIQRQPVPQVTPFSATAAAAAQIAASIFAQAQSYNLFGLCPPPPPAPVSQAQGFLWNLP